jgi:hypothetical protein
MNLLDASVKIQTVVSAMGPRTACRLKSSLLTVAGDNTSVVIDNIVSRLGDTDITDTADDGINLIS